MENSNTKRLLFRAGLCLLGVLLVSVIAVMVVIYMVLTPRKITPVLLNASKDYIHGEVGCESIDITFFSVFPDVGVRLKNGSISSEADTLLVFDQFTATIHPLAFIFRKQLIIRQLSIENADIYLHIDTLGKVNWDIFSSADSLKVKADTTAFVMPELNINNIRLSNVNFTFNDVQRDMFLMVDSLTMRLRGNLTKERADLSFGIRTPAVTAYYQGHTFTRSLPFSFRTTFVRDQLQKTLTIERGTLKAGTIELNTQGVLKQSDDSGIVDVDVDFSLNASSLDELTGMIPERIADFSSKFTADGKVVSNGKLTGQWGDGRFPLVTLSLLLADGTLASLDQPKSPFIEDVNVDFHAKFDPSRVQPSSIKLNNLCLQTASSKLTVKGEFDHILTKPDLKAQVKANIDFTQMSQILPVKGMTMEGQIDFDVSVQCFLEDILASNYGKINANGVADMREVKFRHDAEQIFFYTSNVGLKLGINTKDSMSERFPESLLRCRIVLDTLHLNRKDELVANTSRLSAVLATSEPKDTASIVPITIGSRISTMRLVMGDSVRVRGVQAAGNVQIRPRVDMPDLQEINGIFTIDTLMGRAREMSGRVSKASVKFQLVKQPARQRSASGSFVASDSSRPMLPEGEVISQRSTEMLTRAQRDSLRQIRSDPTTNLSFQIASQETKDLLRNWEFSGGFASNDLSLRTPYYPLQIRMQEPDIAFTDNTVNLTHAHILLGQSDFTLKGEAEGLRRALLYNEKISVKMTLDADSLDFNELIRTAVAGSDYAAKDVSEKDSILNIVLDESMDVAVADEAVASGIFVVPRNLDVEFNSRIQNGKISNIAIRNARGRIILRDQAIQIPRLRLNTSIGSATMTMVYKAPDPQGAYMGLELGVQQIDLKDLISALPVIVEMAPMINSFEGVVDCDMTVVTALDSLMNVRLSETTASCQLSGQNLVLLDGETFAEISKTLMFKNKNKNIIDSMSVEMIMEDDKLMIFPFQLSIDRYNVAVGGIQNLDMSFNYHITVLKSPVPFKLGLNISGTPDDMKIRPGKAKYKNMFTVAREKQLDNTTINLRQEMNEKLQQSIQDIAGMELRQPLRRPRTEIPDSLKQSLFQLEDTLVVNPAEPFNQIELLNPTD